MLSELFNPTNRTNLECIPYMLEIVLVAMRHWKEEESNFSKMYQSYLLSNCSISVRTKTRPTLFFFETHDNAKSDLGCVTGTIQTGSMIGIHRASAQTDEQNKLML